MTGNLEAILNRIADAAEGEAANQEEKARKSEPGSKKAKTYMVMADRMRSQARQARNGNMAAIKWICEKVKGLKAAWADYLQATNKDPAAPEHQLRLTPADDEDGSGGGMSGGPR